MKTEDRLTIACANYLRAKYPNVLFTHVANERKTSAMRGAKLKKMGVRAGVSDMLIFYPCGGYAGLVIELKAEAVTYTNGKKSVKRSYPSASQKEFLTQTFCLGYATDVCWNIDEFSYVVNTYFAGEYEPSKYMKSLVQKEVGATE